jgi:hypothetical protein
MRFGLLAVMLAAIPLSAQAETINLPVQRPAAASDVYMLRSLSVGRFSGADGRIMANMLERELAGLRDIDGSTLFELFDQGAGEGALTGFADASVNERRFTEKRKLCPDTFDLKAKCEDAAKSEVEVSCRSRSIALMASVRIVQTGDGRVLMNRDVPQQSDSRWCNGERTPTDAESIVNDLVRRAVSEVARDLTPFAGVIPTRIRESRRGLDKAASAQFKTAVEATRGDGTEGCALFAALEPVIPAHGPLIYNLALCAEARGDYIGAVAGFERVGDTEARSAAQRARDTDTAKQQFEARHAL